MVDEKIENEDIIVSDTEIENVTREVLRKDEEQKSKAREEIEKEIRAKIAKEEEEKRAKEEKQALQAALVRKEEERVAEIKKLKEELEEAKKASVGSKGLVNTQNPFRSPDNTETTPKGSFSDNLSEEDLKEIDEVSQDKWEEYQRKRR